MDANSMKKIFTLKVEAGGLGKTRKFNDREVSDLLNMAQEEFVMNRFTPDANVKRKGFDADAKRRIDLSGLLTARTEYLSAADVIMQGDATNGALRTPDADHQASAGGSYVATDWGCFVEIPDEAVFIVSATADITDSVDDYENIPVEFISYDQYSDWVRDPYKQPYHSLLWAMQWGDYTVAASSTSTSTKGMTGVSIEDGTTPVSFTANRAHMLIPGKDFTVKKYQIHYVKLPTAVKVDVVVPANKVDCELPAHTHQEIIDIAVRMASAAQVPMEQRYNISDKESKENE